MGGGYISCGEFEGNDKSATALMGVVEELVAVLRWESEPTLVELLENIHAYVTGEGVPPNNWEDEIEILSDQAKLLQPYLVKVRDNLVEATGTASYLDVMEREAEESGEEPTELSWGKGKGWKLYCLHDLLLAFDHSVKSGESVTISFD